MITNSYSLPNAVYYYVYHGLIIVEVVSLVLVHHNCENRQMTENRYDIFWISDGSPAFGSLGIWLWFGVYRGCCSSRSKIDKKKSLIEVVNTMYSYYSQMMTATQNPHNMNSDRIMYWEYNDIYIGFGTIEYAFWPIFVACPQEHAYTWPQTSDANCEYELSRKQNRIKLPGPFRSNFIVVILFEVINSFILSRHFGWIIHAHNTEIELGLSGKVNVFSAKVNWQPDRREKAKIRSEICSILMVCWFRLFETEINKEHDTTSGTANKSTPTVPMINSNKFIHSTCNECANVINIDVCRYRIFMDQWWQLVSGPKASFCTNIP